MKVVHLSTSDLGGGAAQATFRLHTGLRRAGVDSWLVVGHKVSGDDFVKAPISKLRMKIAGKFERLPRKFLRTANPSLISPGWADVGAWQEVNRLRPDVVHLHWINKGFFKIEALKRIEAPIVWSLHDMWAFAGGEHYVGDCTRYRDGYMASNRPAHETGFDLNRWIWNRKRTAWAGVKNVTFLPVSEWLAGRAREALLFRDRQVKVLHNALDPEEFKPCERDAARASLGLPAERPLVLFGAIDATDDLRKGFDLLVAALKELRGRAADLELVVFGNSAEAAQENGDLGFRTHYLGKISDKQKLASVYSACDAMVVPSREESFGQTAMEALACGTPVVAFDVGGLPEIVEHGVSGYLARPFEVSDLAKGIHELLVQARRDSWQRMSAAGRRKVLNEFTLDVQAARALALYEEACARGRTDNDTAAFAGASGKRLR